MFKVIWDPAYNGVRLTMSSKGEALNVAPRPVFWEEKLLLSKILPNEFTNIPICPLSSFTHD